MSAQKTLFVVVEPLVSRVLGVYSSEEKARNRVHQLRDNKNIRLANISQCELDNDIEVNDNIISEDTSAPNNSKEPEASYDEEVKKFRKDVDEFFRELPK
jgi:hypothetical protein